MTLECAYYLAGVGSFFIALGGLIGLVIYALDTRKLRIVAGEQLEAAKKQAEAALQQAVAAQEGLEAAVTPCALIVGDAESESVEAPLSMRNVGAGAAINIQWRLTKVPNPAWTEFPALSPGECRRVPFHMRDVIPGQVECEFESLSGTRYQTRSGFSEDTTNLDFRHEFNRLPKRD